MPNSFIIDYEYREFTIGYQDTRNYFGDGRWLQSSYEYPSGYRPSYSEAEVIVRRANHVSGLVEIKILAINPR